MVAKMTAAGIALEHAALTIMAGDRREGLGLRLAGEVVPRESCLRGRTRSPIK
jgi:hypothetical protein